LAKGHFGAVAARPGELKLSAEAMSLPKQAGARPGELVSSP